MGEAQVYPPRGNVTGITERSPGERAEDLKAQLRGSLPEGEASEGERAAAGIERRAAARALGGPTASKVGCRTLNGGEFGSRVRQLRSRGAAGGCLV